jgi:hypothetical protein
MRILHVRYLIVRPSYLNAVIVPVYRLGVHKAGRALSLFFRPLLWNPVYRLPQDLSTNGGVCESY